MAAITQIKLSSNNTTYDVNDKRISSTAVTTADYLLTCNSAVTSIAPISIANAASVLGESLGFYNSLKQIPRNTVNDLNNLTTNSFMEIYNDTIQNVPNNSKYGLVIHFNVVSSNFQLYVTGDSTSNIKLYARTKYSNTWYSWCEI